MPREKTLNEKLAELANPSQQYIDPEDEYNEDTKARLDPYEEDYETEKSVFKKTTKNKTSLRQTNAVLLATTDRRYAGKRVSRKDLDELENSASEELSDSIDDSEAEDLQSFREKIAGLEKAKKNVTNGKKTQSKEFSDGVSEEDDLDESLSENDEEADEEECSNGDCEEEDDENVEEEEEEEENELDDEGNEEQCDGDLEEECDEDEEKVLRVPKNSEASDIVKGKCIQNQLSLWDNLLECRIKIHKGIHLSNQLPQGPTSFKLFSKTGEKQFISAMHETQSAVKSLLDSCIELQDILLKSNPLTKNVLKRNSDNANDEDDEEIASDTEEEQEESEEEEKTPQRKRLKVDEYEKELLERHQQFRDYCNRTLHLWNEKTKLASGRLVGASKPGFGAFEQSIQKQIEIILSDKQRLINRTRIKRSTYRVLGKIRACEESSALPVVEQNIEGEAVPVETKSPEEDLDPEIYDDDDFYHQLLRELIEKRTIEGGSDQIAIGRQWLEIQKLRSKAKRKVDPKASKGRRLRFQVLPKLVSFMAPHPETAWNDTAKNELFASLFGAESVIKN